MTTANDLAVRRTLEGAGVNSLTRMGAAPGCACATANEKTLGAADAGLTRLARNLCVRLELQNEPNSARGRQHPRAATVISSGLALAAMRER